MRIINRTRKTTISKEAEVAKGFWKKTLGLMFRSGIRDDWGFLMEFRDPGFHGIWMFCMRFPIDVVFLDSEKRVAGICRGARPLSPSPASWRLYKPPRPVKWVLELKNGRITSTKTRVGDSFSFKSK